jgi:hypothetical protein
MAKEDIAIGVVAGVALAALVPLAIMIAGGDRRALVRALARSGQVLSDKARETFAEFQEITEDLVAEMRTPGEAITGGSGATAAAESPSKPAEAAAAHRPRRPRARRAVSR